jgi:hypothetical protein
MIEREFQNKPYKVIKMTAAVYKDERHSSEMTKKLVLALGLSSSLAEGLMSCLVARSKAHVTPIYVWR